MCTTSLQTSTATIGSFEGICLAVAHRLGICYAAHSMRAALEWVDVLDRDPLQRVNAMNIRKIVRLQHGGGRFGASRSLADSVSCARSLAQTQPHFPLLGSRTPCSFLFHST
jgi:hypothetical protein